jgi:hypothetical protein
VLVVLLTASLRPRPGFAWGHEGHQIIALIAEHYMTDSAKAKATAPLDGNGIDVIASWADEYRTQHHETAPWHYIDCPLAEPKIDMAQDCSQGDGVIAKTEEFLNTLRDPAASQAAKAEALKFVAHFVGDLHQPLHDEDNHDKGGNTRHVVFERHPDNLHWVWDTGLLEPISRNPSELAEELERRITAQNVTDWDKGSILDWANEGHQIAQAVAYGEFGNENPAPITAAYEKQAEAAIELQLERAAVRLARLLNLVLK